MHVNSDWPSALLSRKDKDIKLCDEMIDELKEGHSMNIVHATEALMILRKMRDKFLMRNRILRAFGSVSISEDVLDDMDVIEKKLITMKDESAELL